MTMYKIPLTQDQISGKGVAVTVGGGILIDRFVFPLVAKGWGILRALFSSQTTVYVPAQEPTPIQPQQPAKKPVARGGSMEEALAAARG